MLINPKVSIIIPNYNHAAFLQQRLESVFNQTYQDFEVILLDDASTDRSLDILNAYKNHPKVSHFIVNKTNSGSPFKQWQKGIDLAKGEYIWIAESDDYCEPVFLEELLKQFDKNTVLAYCASKNTDQEGNVLGLNTWANQVQPNRWENDFKNKGTEEIKHYLRFRNTIPNASAVVFRNCIDAKEIAEQMKFCGDWLLWIKILQKGEIAYLSLPLNSFRKHKESSRSIKSFREEKTRFNEYFFIINKTSSIFSRIKHRKKYNWILEEWKQKSKYFKKASIFKLNMPLDFILRYLI